MRFSGPRAHHKADLSGAEHRGPTKIIRAAIDPVRPPEDIETVAVIQRCLCRVTIGEDVYMVTGMTGDERKVPYGAPLSKWEEVCGELLELAAKSETLE